MTHGRLPNLWRRVYVTWCCFWLHQQQERRADEITELQRTWSAIPARVDDLKADIAAIDCLIADYEQELL